MGMAVTEGATFLLGLLLGVPVSALGIALARVERKRVSIWIGLAGLILNLLPLPMTRLMNGQTLRGAHPIQLAP